MRTGLEYHEMESLLIRWGDWQERHYLEPSLPECSAFCRIYADQPQGDRILCAEMDYAVYKINQLILALRPRSQDALLVWYAANLKPLGGFWTAIEKAEKLEISLRALKVRVWRAKRSLKKKILNGSRQKSDPYLNLGRKVCEVSLATSPQLKISEQPWSIEPLVVRTVPA